MSYENQKVELQIQKEIRLVEDDLVIWIQKALEETKYGDLEESQFRNLLRVADTTESAEVIKNFLKYQVGRDKKWGRGKDSLAERIIQDIDTHLQKTAQQISSDVHQQNTDHIIDIDEAAQREMKSIWIQLIRRYLGYGSRYLKYKRDGNKS